LYCKTYQRVAFLWTQLARLDNCRFALQLEWRHLISGPINGPDNNQDFILLLLISIPAKGACFNGLREYSPSPASGHHFRWIQPYRITFGIEWERGNHTIAGNAKIILPQI
jgi:hypothetical protein